MTPWGAPSADPPAAGAAAVVALAVLLAAAVAVAALARRAERVVAEQLGQHYVAELRDLLVGHLTRVPARELGRRNRGDMLLCFVGDLSALRTWVSLGLARLLVAGVAVTLAVGALTLMSVGIGLATAVVLLAGAAGTVAASRQLVVSTRVARRRRARLTGEVTGRLVNVGVVQAAGQERRERRRVRRHSERVVAAMLDRARAAGNARAVAEATVGLTAAAVVLVGALEVRAGRTGAGTVVGALAVTGLLSGLLRELGRVTEYAAAARVGRDAAARLLALPTLDDGHDLPPLAPGPGRLELRGLGLDDVLHGVDVTVEPGTTVAVVGPNHAGESTLVALASRMVAPGSGQVLPDGQDLAVHDLATVRAAVGVAGPDLPLLKGSIGRNVRYRVPRVEQDELQRVAVLCELDKVLDDLPDGWSSDVGDGCPLLTAGQRARVALARAALGRPRLLVLDEADAHLDALAAEVVDAVLADCSGTALVVTHRRALVVCLVDGRIVEVGTPGQVLFADGPTARLLGSGPSARSAHRPGVPGTA